MPFYNGYKRKRYPLPATGNDLGDIVLEVDATRLGEAQATASRLQRTAKGYTMNLRGDIRCGGNNVHDVLALLPQVSQDQEGNILIDNQPVRAICINNMPLKGGIQELKAMPGSMLDSVEVQTLRDASYTSGEGNGEIHLFLAKMPKGGYYGALVGQLSELSDYGKFGGGASGIIYYKRGRLSLYDYADVNDGRGVMDEYEGTDMPDGSQKTGTYSYDRRKHWDVSNHLSMALDLQGDQFLGLAYYLKHNDMKRNMRQEYESVLGREQTSVRRDSTMDWTHDLTLRYKLTTGKRKHTVDVLADYLHMNDDLAQMFTYAAQGDQQAQPFGQRNYIDMLYGKAEWGMPLSGKWGRVEAGVKVNYVNRRIRPAEPGADEPDMLTGRYTPFNAKTLMPVAYASWYGSLTSRIDYYAGLNYQKNRVEYAPAEGLSATNVQRGLNPTARIVYKFNPKKGNDVAITYSHSLGSIDYDVVNPNRMWANAMLYTVGNPDLKATRSHSLKAVMHLLQNQLAVLASFSQSRNGALYVTRRDEERPDVYYTKPVNKDGKDRTLNLAAEYGRRILPWWYGKAAANFYLRKEDSDIDGVRYDGWNTLLRAYMMHRFSFKKSWYATLYIDYEPAHSNYNEWYNGVYGTRLTVTKSLLKNKLDISFNGNYGNGRRVYRQLSDGSRQTYQNLTHFGNMSISVVWRFNGGRDVNVREIQREQEYYKSGDMLVQ